MAQHNSAQLAGSALCQASLVLIWAGDNGSCPTSQVHASCAQRDMGPGLSPGQPMGVWAATQTVGRAGMVPGSRERLDISGTAASCDIYPASPVLIPERLH